MKNHNYDHQKSPSVNLSVFMSLLILLPSNPLLKISHSSHPLGSLTPRHEINFLTLQRQRINLMLSRQKQRRVTQNGSHRTTTKGETLKTKKGNKEQIGLPVRKRKDSHFLDNEWSKNQLNRLAIGSTDSEYGINLSTNIRLHLLFSQKSSSSLYVFRSVAKNIFIWKVNSISSPHFSNNIFKHNLIPLNSLLKYHYLTSLFMLFSFP